MIEIPVVAKMTTDSRKEILFAARCALSNHTVIISTKAKHTVALLKKLRQSHDKKSLQNNHTGNELPKLSSQAELIGKYESKEDQIVVQHFFQKSLDFVSFAWFCVRVCGKKIGFSSF